VLPKTAFNGKKPHPANVSELKGCKKTMIRETTQFCTEHCVPEV